MCYCFVLFRAKEILFFKQNYLYLALKLGNRFKKFFFNNCLKVNPAVEGKASLFV